jgi:YbbR domain-containing protein
MAVQAYTGAEEVIMQLFKNLIKNIPTLLTAVLLAVAVWILAVTNIDPVERRTFGRPVEIEVVGLDPSLVITNEIPDQVSLVLSAPSSTWSSQLNATNAVRAIVDLAGLEEGTYEVPVRLQIDARPVNVESHSPDVVDIRLEQLFSRTFDINLAYPSAPAIGYNAGSPQLSAQTATVSGPASQVNRVTEVRATLDISQDIQNINRELPLVALDENGLRISSVSISPERVNVQVEITQRGGYRNLTVKVVTSGQIASGYRLTNIFANPLVVTVFSTDPEQVNNLPGFVETQPVNLSGADDDLEASIPLNLPSGVIVVGESTVRVSVSISPIEGSITLNNLPVELVGNRPEYTYEISPEQVDVILSGPLPSLETLRAGDVRVVLDLTEYLPGVYQVEPQVQLEISGILVESILPAVIEVEIIESQS